MRAAVFHAHHDIRIEDVPEPATDPGQVKIAVAHNGLCGSDLHEYLHGPLVIPTTPHPLTGAQLPVIMGHEFAGTVTEVGEGVADIAPGDRVAVEPIYHCGHCRPCTDGAYNVCRSLAFYGLMSSGGGLAERAVVPAEMIHKLPDRVTLEQGALVEPMAVAEHAVRRTGVQPGESAVIFGAGPIGLGSLFALQAAGAGPIIVIETSPTRRALAEMLGATHVIDPAETPAAPTILDLTDGEGTAVAVDAAGAPVTALGTLQALRSRGRAVTVAVHGAPIEMDPNLLLAEQTWTGSLGYTAEDFATVIGRMANGGYPTEGWVEHLALDDLTEGFDAMSEGRSLKVVVDLTDISDR